MGLLEKVIPRDIPTIINWSLKTKDSFFLMNSVLPMGSEDIAIGLANPNEQWFMIKDKTPQGLIKLNKNTIMWTMQPSQNNTKLMTAAIEEALTIAFEQRKNEKLWLYCLPYEIELKTVATKLRFSLEGTYKQHRFMNDKYFDVEIFGLSQKEYYGK